jgi:peptidoglycan/LPS O-acetylase OafA/YrhL
MNQSSSVVHTLAYRPDIDGLRAIAVIAVLFFHAFPKLSPGGFVGVDIFFVISGYLISSILYAALELNTFSLLDFYARRIRRIFPALIVILVAGYLFGWFYLFVDEFSKLGSHTFASAGFIQNWILASESGYFDSSADLKPYLHLWSLGVEEQFYIVWPIFLWLAWKLRINLLIATFALGLA